MPVTGDGMPVDQDNGMEYLTAALDTDQAAGVMAGSGLTIVTAGAGTGKTRVLTTRIVRMVREGVPPQGIVAVTFTRKAANEMRERATAMAGNAVAGVRFSTLHSLAAAILRRNPAAANLDDGNFLIADDDEVREIVTQAVSNVGLGTDDDTDSAAFAREAAKRIARLKENGMSVAIAQEQGPSRSSHEERDLAMLYVEYARLMADRRLVDFGDLVSRAVDAMESDPAVLQAEAGGISHILVDEFQDTNKVQLRLVELLSSLGADVTIVGDDDQSIYSFRSSIDRLMEHASLSMPSVVARGLNKVDLTTNYRCTDQVLAPAVLLVDYNRRQEPKVLRSGRDGDLVSATRYPSDVAEAEGISNRIEKLMTQGVKPSGIAILVRAKSVLGEVGKSLFRHGIPHVMQAGTPFSERTEVKDVMAYLKLAADPRHDLAFRRIAARPTRGLGEVAVQAVLDIVQGDGDPLHEALAQIAVRGGMPRKAREGSSLMAGHLRALADMALAGDHSHEIVDHVIHTMGYSEWAHAQKDAPGTLDDSLASLVDAARNRPSFMEFLTETSLGGDGEEQAMGAVHVGTMHGAKGLEWDHVFLPAFEEGVIPSSRSMEEDSGLLQHDGLWKSTGGGGLEEERRLAHVGMTRARDGAYVSCAERRRTFGKDRACQPSRLLNEAELDIRQAPRKGAIPPGNVDDRGRRQTW